MKAATSAVVPVLLKPQQELIFDGDLKTFLPLLELFREITPSVLQEFTAKFSVHRFAANELLPAQAELEKSCWIVLEGVIERRAISSAGTMTAVDVAAQGDIFGCLFGACSVPMHVESVALAPSVVAGISCEDCRAILPHAPLFNQNLIRLLARRLREARELRAMTAEHAGTRVLWSLLLLYLKLGAELPLTRANMAEVAGVARETVIRALSPLEKRGDIRTLRGTIHVLNPQGLAAFLEKTKPPAELELHPLK